MSAETEAALCDRRSSGLAPPEDAYGQLLLAYQEGRESAEIMERDDGLVYCGDPGAYFAPYRRWPAAERRAMRYVRGRVLDVGCGAGRVSLHLQERGHRVVAIDESPLAVRVARTRGVRSVHVRSVNDLGAELGRFDTILIARNNPGLAGTQTAARRLLRRLTTIATGRGRLVTDSVDPSRLEPHLREYGGRPGAIPRYRVRFLRYASPWFRYLMLSPGELERLVDSTGWRVHRILDDGSPRYVVVLDRVES